METQRQKLDRLYIELQEKRSSFWQAHNAYVSGSLSNDLKEKREIARSEWTVAESLFDKELWNR